MTNKIHGNKTALLGEYAQLCAQDLAQENLKGTLFIISFCLLHTRYFELFISNTCIYNGRQLSETFKIRDL